MVNTIGIVLLSVLFLIFYITLTKKIVKIAIIELVQQFLSKETSLIGEFNDLLTTIGDNLEKKEAK